VAALAKTSWVIVAFDTLLKIAPLFSSTVVSRTHELLLAKPFRHWYDASA
jgi:hypothetical protein